MGIPWEPQSTALACLCVPLRMQVNPVHPLVHTHFFIVYKSLPCGQFYLLRITLSWSQGFNTLFLKIKKWRAGVAELTHSCLGGTELGSEPRAPTSQSGASAMTALFIHVGCVFWGPLMAQAFGEVPGKVVEESGSISAMLQSVLLWLLLKINENLLLCKASQTVLVVKNLPPNAGDIRNVGSIPRWGRPPGGGHSNPLQYSCLENPMGRGAWWSAIQRIAKSWTWLSHLASMHALLYSFLGSFTCNLEYELLDHKLLKWGSS